MTGKSQTTVFNGASLTHSLSYSYDADGRLASQTYPSGLVIVYGYDSEGRVNAISLNGQTLLTNLVYEPFGPPQSWTWVSGQTYSRTFDADGRLSDYPLGLDTRFVSYDPAGRITGYSHTTAANDRSFDYDLVDRLILDSDGTTSRSFAYDANGNRTDFNQNGNSALYTIDPGSNRLLGLSGSMMKTYSYDAAGHLTGNGTTTFDWNAAGRLARMMTGALSNIYRYTGLGERVIKAGAYITQQPHRYIYDPQGHLIGEYDKNNALRQETVWLGDLPVAAVKKDAAGLFQFYPVQADHLNAPRVILNSANTSVWRWDAADAFGTVLPNGDPDGDGILFEYNLRFPGQFYDKETGLHYNYFRDYDPVTGQYIASDPIGLAGGLNTYGYVNGNPIRWSDPFGLAPGDPYDSANEAVQEVAKDILDMGPQRIEWGGWIYEMTNGKFSYTKPRTDNEETHVSPGSKFICPGEPVADYHTHWAKNGYKYNIFSKDDKWSNFLNQTTGYLIKPDGSIDIYVPPPYWEVPSRFRYDMGYTGRVK
ncbi:RHS repeat-associated core domain-containing protein [Methylosarcina fibrata]|uniref:RHS repeat-associated core domain-containing protein n=1 Tax=Methylosarcina fibrata TaxID=105972 RepID=UPI00039E985B